MVEQNNNTKQDKRIVLSQIQKETLQDMKGTETSYLFNGETECVGIEYPHIWVYGTKHKLTSSQWSDLLNQYWNDSNNEGYWLIKNAEKEFGL